MVMQAEASEVLGEFLVSRTPELREKVVLQSVPLVHYLLARMGISQEMGSDYEDLAHQGLMGLIEAVDQFDPDFSARFSTYASLRIRGKILDYLRSSDWMPRAARKRTRMIQKSINSLLAENQREPTEDEIATHLEISVDDVRQGLADSNRVLMSLDTMMTSDTGEEGSLYEYLQDDGQENPEEALEQKSMIAAMAEAIDDLTDRQKLILSLYYNDELTFKEIGTVLGLTESRVCQLHSRAIMTLKAMMQDAQ